MSSFKIELLETKYERIVNHTHSNLILLYDSDERMCRNNCSSFLFMYYIILVFKSFLVPVVDHIAGGKCLLVSSGKEVSLDLLKKTEVSSND